MRIFIVQGVHPVVPGIVLKVFATRAGAVEEAVSLVNTIAEKTDATIANWEKVLAKLQKKHGKDDCDVWITEQDLLDAPSAAAAVPSDAAAHAMLRKIVDYSTPSTPDSTGQAMRRVRSALIDQARAIVDATSAPPPAADIAATTSAVDPDEAAARAAGWTHGIVLSTYPDPVIYRSTTDAEKAAAAPGANRDWISAASWREACERDRLLPGAAAAEGLLKPLIGPHHGPSLDDQLRLAGQLGGTQDPQGVKERQHAIAYGRQMAAQMLSTLEFARDVLAEYAAVAPAGTAAEALGDVETTIARAAGTN